jgi:hypothetical protein
MVDMGDDGEIADVLGRRGHGGLIAGTGAGKKDGL